MIQAQSPGVLGCLRLIKALLELGHEVRELQLTGITVQSVAVHAGEQIEPSAASVHGLLGSVSKEYRQWGVRVLELPAQDPWPAHSWSALPADG